MKTSIIQLIAPMQEPITKNQINRYKLIGSNYLPYFGTIN